MDAYRVAFNTWQEKTEWVQKDKRFDVLLPWGKHRADVMKEYIDHLEAKCAGLLEELASIEAEPVAYVMADDLKDSSIISTPAYRDLGEAMERTVGDVVALYTTTPAPVSVPDTMADDIDSDDHPLLWSYKNGWNACRAAMLQGAEPVTTKDDSGQSEQDDSPECGWVVTHTGKDYFYREQKDAVTHMNSAVESGLGVSLRSFIPEPVTTANKLPDGWVACSERMPERDIDVQVYCSDKKEQMVGYMERNEQDGYFRFASLPNGGGVYCQPTHWMPLPAAPQQE